MLLPALLAVALAEPTAIDRLDSLSNAMPPVRAIRLAAPLAVDGELSEEVWKNGNAVSNFTQLDPVEGAPPSQRTEVRVAFDDDALYVGARMYDSAPDSIIANLARRDVEIPADRLSVYLDPYHDRRSGYYFRVNAAGTLYDGTLSNDGWNDSSWDGVWSARVRRDREGWTAEMRIPFSQLRFSHGTGSIWGINFSRNLQRRSEGVYVAYTPKKESGFVSRFPHLVGLDGLPERQSIEVMPYATGKAEMRIGEKDDPFHDRVRRTGDAGADLRASIAGKLTLNATVNPDFGQVEVDPAVVNLGDFETYFPEKRPFFVDGSSYFRFGNEGASDYWNFNWPEPTFFYSRRVGRAPQGEAPDADWTRYPTGTTILGAAKLTGKIAPTWNFGTIHALTAKEEARLETAGLRSESEVEPMTYYGVIRAQKEFPKRQKGLGFMSSVVTRNFENPALEDALNRTSLLGGLDGWIFLDKDQKYVISGWSVVSRMQGTRTDITALQQNPRHYFQRPDADHVEVDTSATSLTGIGTRLWLNKQKGPAILNAALGFISPGFDVNDIGFMNRADVVNGHVATGYRWTEPTKLRKYQQLNAAVWGGSDFGGNLTDIGLYGGGYTEFSNNYSWDYSANYIPERVSNRRTRGGPLTKNAALWAANTYFDTDGKAKRFYYVSVNGEQAPSTDSWSLYVEPGIELKPVSNLSLSIAPSLLRAREDAQYVGEYDDPTATATYGRRYVFAVLDQTEVAGNIRLNWSFTPTVSLQLFGQPLWSRGDYHGLKGLARPNSYAFDVYGRNGSTFDPASGTVDPDGAGPAAPFVVDDPDFNFGSLRGNAVFRWEYRPGSTLFLVWTQTRQDSETRSDFDLTRQSRRLFDTEPENIFLAKVTYYLGL